MNEQNPTEQTIGGDPAEDATSSYDIDAIQDKWQKIWTDLDPFKVRDDDSAERRYLLDMYPYPSGDLHMGHAEAWALADVIARWWFQQGYDVLHPVGWDSFGLPAENAAIKRGENPALFTEANIATQAESFRHYAISFDWSKRVETHDPAYYRSCTSTTWRTARTARSTGARTTRRCWPTSRSSPATASAAAPR